MRRGESHDRAVAWRCPVCRQQLTLLTDGPRWACVAGHSFDVAREGYVNLLLARSSRQPGDSPEMVAARRRFLASGAYDPLSLAIAEAVASLHPRVVLDVGCGEGRHTRAVCAPTVLGVDVAKSAVAVAARSHPDARYAVASAADLPVADSAVDVAMTVFGPIVAAELARVIRPGGAVVAAHPGPHHLDELRQLVYTSARRRPPQSPLGDADQWFAETTSTVISFPVVLADAASLGDLFTMTPWRWHAPPDIDVRLAAAVSPRFETVADIRLTSYVRTDRRAR